MHAYSLLAAAKINLYLEIVGSRPDGYHELIMVMQSIELADPIDLRSNGTDRFRVHCQHPAVPQDQTNLAYRAAELMATTFPKAFEQYGGIDITIQKQIPVGAGLAGGSTDAAGVLVGIDLLWKLGLTHDELQELGAKLGSDVPFCIAGGTMLATGRGEELTPLPEVDLFLVLGKYHSLSVSTAWAYQTYRQQFSHSYISDAASLEARRQHIHSGPMVQAIAQRDPAQIAKLLHNDLEKVVLPAHPQVQALRNAFQHAGAIGAMMSGSGPTVFALAESPAHAQQIQQQVRAILSDPDLDLWVTHTTHAGIQVIQ
jgi:4-diphosphocytidyl-2-C-methyl-D-erythritol kinase